MAYSTSSAYTGSNEFSSGPYLACLAIVNASRASANSTSVSISGTFYLGFGSTTAYSGSTQGTGYANSATLSGNGVSSSVTVKSSSSTWTCAGGSAVKFNSNYTYTGKKPHLSSSGWSGTISNWTSGNKSFTITVYENSTSLKTFTVTLACPTYYPTVTISYNGNGNNSTDSTMSNTTYTYASSGTTSLRKNTYTKTGYYFYGWHRTQSKATAGEREYTDEQSWNLNNAGPTYTLYASWRPETYTVYYNANGGSGEMEPSTVIYGQSFITRQNIFTKTGYTFNGWRSKLDPNDTQYTSENWGLTAAGVYESGQSWVWQSTSNTDYASDRYLYAQWVVNSYTLTVNAGEGTLTTTSGWEIIGNTATKNFNYGSSYGTLPTPTRTGYVFSGWYTSATGGTQVTSNTTMGDSNTEVFAHWAVAQYTVVYHANTGSGTTPNSQTFGYSESINLASSSGLTLSNYTANGWNTASGTNQSSNTHFDNGAVFNSASATFNSNRSVTLYVHWVGAQYTISYNANEGSGAPASQTGNYGTSLTIQTAIPTRTNYYFKGWNTKQDGSGDTYQPGETYNKYLTVTLYAQWESNDFSINFDSNYLQDYNVTRNQVAFGRESRDNAFNSHSALSQGLYTTGIYVKSAILDNYGTGVLSGQLMASNLERALTKASYSSGIMGSINLTTAYTTSTPNIPTGWYNYLYIPHRNGGNNGAIQSDNCGYGSMLLFGMNNDNGIFRIRRNNTIVEKFYTTLNKPSASDIGAVSTLRTINNKALSSNITLSASDVGALPISGGTMTDNGQIINGHITNSNTRETTPDLTPTGKRGITALLASSAMTTNCPGEGTIIHCEWDNNGGWNSQLFVADNDSGNGKPFVAVRGQKSGTWTAWDRLLAESDIKDYVVEEGPISSPAWWKYYRKWNSGLFELDGYYSGAPTTGSHYSNIVTDNTGTVKLYGYRSENYSFPSECVPIDTNYTVLASWKIGSGFAFDCGTVSTQTTQKFSIYAISTAGNQTSIAVQIYVRGRWK